MQREQIKHLVAQMTLEEKAGLTAGENGWWTKACERLNIPAVHMTDGPHGLRNVIEENQNMLNGNTMEAVCFPAECAMASSFDRDLLFAAGQELGREAAAAGVDILLGPGVNMKRSPLCGRNFEYFSEDPYLAGELGAAYVNGVQSEGVGTSLKHFFANNQEYRRYDSSSEPDERAMREIYLTAFETVVKKAQPWTIMASYNKINGVYSTENKTGLTHILRDEWGFQGTVISDWGATHDRAAVVSAGCDLTMPAPGTDGAVVDAVKNEFLDERDLDACCERVLELVFKAVEQRATRSKAALDLESGHQFVAAAAADGMVLLKNDDDLLPLKSTESLAFIGRFAAAPRFQGGGSANIHAFKTTSALDAAKAAGLAVSYVDGYEADGSTNADLLAEAVAAAKAADVAVVFAGLHDEMEVEGYDRAHMRMSDGHNSLIEAVCAANPNTVVVLHNGSPIEMPWVKLPKAILETYLGGQAVGEATINVLTGVVNPSGHLAETFPKACSDNPSYLFFGGEDGVVPYPEGVFIGYRYYTSKSIETLFPFGHGLSYTTFAYRDLRLDATCAGNTDTVTATVTVQNTGDRAGKALVQLYVAPPKSRKVIRPVRELKAFEKIELQPGESRTVTLSLPSRAFAHWNTAAHDWRIEPGEYGIQICENATSVLLQETVVIA